MSNTKIDDTAETLRNEQIESIRKYNEEEQRQNIDITFYEIYPIQIMIQSNVPNKPEFALKSSMFITEPRPNMRKNSRKNMPRCLFLPMNLNILTLTSLS
jgi:transcription-repair coupling factor (superfamily II helicase)